MFSKNLWDKKNLRTIQNTSNSLPFFSNGTSGYLQGNFAFWGSWEREIAVFGRVGQVLSGQKLPDLGQKSVLTQIGKLGLVKT
jgi:hypothetical protein